MRDGPGQDCGLTEGEARTAERTAASFFFAAGGREAATRETVTDDAPRKAAQPRPKQRQDNIDLLRAIAIVSVLLYHYTARHSPAFYNADQIPFTFPWGRHGVDIFFVVSGFCIFMTLDHSRSLENFWARRFARIQPAYVFAILVTWTVVTIAGLPERGVSLPVALSNMIWFNAIPTWPAVDSAYWSLVVELKFYFLIGLLYYGMRGRNVSLAWLAVCVMGQALALIGGTAELIGNQVLIVPMAPFFLAGLLAWEWPRLEKRPAAAVGLFTLVLALMSARFADYPLTAPLMVAATVAILRMKNLKVAKPITFVGLVSYSLYLLHQNIGYVVIRALPLPIGVRLIIAALVVFALAAGFYALVERRWERLVQQWAERLLARGRHGVRLPQRQLSHTTGEREIRAW